MLDFGFSEILLTSAIALVVLGPERLPKVARQVGNWMGRARLMARQLSEQLEREVDAEELLRQQLKPPLKPDLLPSRTDQPSLIAPATSPVLSAAPASVAMDDAAAGAPAAGVAEAERLPAPRPLPDGHATTAAAMHPPANSAANPAAAANSAAAAPAPDSLPAPAAPAPAPADQPHSVHP